MRSNAVGNAVTGLGVTALRMLLLTLPPTRPDPTRPVSVLISAPNAETLPNNSTTKAAAFASLSCLREPLIKTLPHEHQLKPATQPQTARAEKEKLA